MNLGQRGIALFSTKRSSHHAFLEGILQNRSYIYENNVRIKNGRLTSRVVKKSPDDNDDRELYVLSFETAYRLPKIYDQPAFQNFENNFQRSVDCKRVLFIRDPLNTLASSYSAYLSSETRTPKYVRANLDQWVHLANYCMSGWQDELIVYANRFWSDDAYRVKCMEELGTPDAKHSTKLSRFARGGNSFFDGKENGITPAALTSRFKKYLDDPEFMSILRQPQIVDVFLEFLHFVRDEPLADTLRRSI